MHSNESSNEVTAQPAQVEVPRREADSDEQLIELWLHGRSQHTQRAYRVDAERFLVAVDKPLHAVGLHDLQRFADELETADLRPASRHRMLSAVKSLFSFGRQLGYLPFDVARPLRLPPLRDDRAERILEETDVLRMIAMESMPRNRVILLTLYAGGFRVSELCGLKWSDLQRRESAGQASVFGKGGKTRTVLLPESVWTALQVIRVDAADDNPVFMSRKGGHLNATQIWRIVRKAAQRAAIDKAVSAHWLRHAHASHALDRGAPIHLVQVTLGHASVATTGRYLHARPSDSSSNYLHV